MHLFSQRCCLLNVVQSTEGELPSWLPYLASPSLYKLAKARHRLPVGVRQILLNKKGREWPWLSLCWIWRKSDNPLSNGINPQVTPPSPLKVVSYHGEFSWRLLLADFASPRGKSALKTRRLAKRWGGVDAMNGGFVASWWIVSYVVSQGRRYHYCMYAKPYIE